MRALSAISIRVAAGTVSWRQRSAARASEATGRCQAAGNGFERGSKCMGPGHARAGGCRGRGWRKRADRHPDVATGQRAYMPFAL